MAEVIMPKMSDAMTEGKVLSWRKHAGDRVARGDIIAEIETDKVNVEIEAEAGGTLSEVLVPEGQTAPVGAVIAYINGRGADAHPAAAVPPAGRAARSAPEPAAPQAAPEPAVVAGTPAQAAPPAPPSQAAPPAPAGTGEAPGRVKATPLARRMAAERGVDLSRVAGTGPGGRIVERDVEAAFAKAPATPPPAPATPPPGGAVSPGAGEGEYEDIELSRMRQAIARSVVQSTRTTPHFYVTTDVEMQRALDLRTQLKEAYGDGGAPSVNDLMLKATALALRARPDLNARFIEPAAVRRFRRVHVGVMVAVPDGLVVPVLHDADRLPLLALARESRRLAEGARQRRLRQEDFTGATFSVSNLGMYGDVASFAAIINAPQAGILAVGRIQARAVVRDGGIVARPVVSLTVSIDHRVTDGVGAAEFLAEVKRLLEHPVLLVAPDGAGAAAGAPPA